MLGDVACNIYSVCCNSVTDFLLMPSNGGDCKGLVSLFGTAYN